MSDLYLVITTGMDGPSVLVMSRDTLKTLLDTGHFGDDPIKTLRAGERIDMEEGTPAVYITEYHPVVPKAVETVTTWELP